MWLLLSIFTLASLGIYTGGSIPSSHLMSYITKRKGETAFLECQFKNILKHDIYTHWYRQKPGQPPKRMLYISSRGNVVYEEGFSEERYEAKQWQNDLSSNLRIYQVTEEDTGTYYCACWVPLY